MVKIKMFFDKDKETRWLNAMMAEGYAMTGYFLIFYIFNNTDPGKYTYQIDLLDQPFSVPESYRDFMNSLHVEIIRTWFFWVYLRKPVSEGAFELYTDAASRIEHYEKILRLFRGVTFLEVMCLVVQLMCALAGKVFWAVITTPLLAIILGLLLGTMQVFKRKISSLKEGLD